MNIRIISQEDDLTVFALRLSRSELDRFTGGAAQELAEALAEQVRDSELVQAGDITPPSEPTLPEEPFLARNYLGVSIERGESGEQELTERLLDKIIEDNHIRVDEAEASAEIEYTLTGTLQSMKYQRLIGGGGHLPDQEEVERLREEIRRETLRSMKLKKLLESVIEQEDIRVSQHELEQEAEAMARRQNMSVDMVKRFFGEDLSGLEGEVRAGKAVRFIVQSADIH